MHSRLALPSTRCGGPPSGQLDPTSLSPSGALLTLRTTAGLTLTDLERDEVSTIALAGVQRLIALDRAVLALGFDGGWRLHRIDPERAEPSAVVDLPVAGERVELHAVRIGPPTVIVSSERQIAVRIDDAGLALEPIQIGAAPGLLVTPGAWLELGAAGILLRRPEGAICLEPARDSRARLVHGAPLFDGRMAAIELRGEGEHRLLIVDLETGRLVQRFQLDGIEQVGLVERRGHAVLARRDGLLSTIDLANGRCLRELSAGGPIAGIACDADGRRLVIATADGRLVIAPYPAHLVVATVVAAPAPVTAPAPAPVTEPPPAPEPEPEPALWEGRLEALGPAVAAAPSIDDRAWYLRDALALALARCRRADAVQRAARGAPADDLDEHGAALAAERARWHRRWSRPDVPHQAIAADLGLSALAVEVLWLVAAPQVFGELARLYGALVAGPGRVCDELLVAQLLDADPIARADLARELAPDAPLIRTGAIAVAAGTAPFASLSADAAMVARLRGDPAPGVPEGLGVRDAAPSLAAIVAPRRPLAAVVSALARPGDRPARIVLRGPTGAGRRTVAATLAARAGRRLGVVSIGGEPDAAPRARLRLQQCVLRGWLPCVDTTELEADGPIRDAVGAVLDAHPGPLFVRCDPEAAPPIEPGHLLLDLPAPSVTGRRELWRGAAAGAGLDADAEALALQGAATPGVIHRVVTAVAARGALDRDATASLASALRQHRDLRLGRVATRIDARAGWSQLIAPTDVVETLGELVARVRHRRRALEEWGFERVASTARGTAALFQGGPGTGKTLAAGVIAGELGRELYRIDLSRIVSKWIGETEKNLGVLFDAAEDGDVVLLFDEADALFAKRTEVKSSNDRHANTTVDYLLQRLDGFRGVAILTTNLGGSIDAAFRRRMAFQITFPLPDAADRERLWRAHIPDACPVAGDLGLRDLAERYEMSGGYIRNAMLRAAFLAAAEGAALRAEHLERAVRAEYRDQGRLHTGRLE